MKHRITIAMTLAATALMASALVASAQENYPAKPITHDRAGGRRFGGRPDVADHRPAASARRSASR